METMQLCGGCFTQAGDALAFINHLLGTKLTGHFTCRYHVAAQTWWIELPQVWQQVAHLIWASGGKPYTQTAEGWVGIDPTGQTLNFADKLDLSEWRLRSFATLLARTVLPNAQVSSLPVVYVLTRGMLARWIVRRAVAIGVQVHLTSATQAPLDAEHQTSQAILLKLTSPHSSLPLALLRSLASLPYTLVARTVGISHERLLIDIRCRASVQENIISDLIPNNEWWLLGQSDYGHWRVRLQGGLTEASLLLSAPILPAQSNISSNFTHETLPPLPLKLVKQADTQGRIDAVLLDKNEIRWLATYLSVRPLQEQAFFLPSATHYLVLAPTGLTTALPFGLPLRRSGKHGLYVECGLGFYPQIPDIAKQSVFQLQDKQLVVITATDSYRFDTQQLMPIWTLWLGESPTIQSGLNAEATQMLNRLSEQIRQADIRQAIEQQNIDLPDLNPDERPHLLEAAMQAELAGDWVRAAELLESAGELGAAGRLYEKAALQGEG